MMNENDLKLVRAAIGVANRARNRGNHPFGAILANEEGHILLEAENTVITERDCTGHAETNLLRLASKTYRADFLAKCTLYTSTEPCPMCAGAIFWGNVRRVIYGLSEEGLYGMIGEDSEDVLYLPCRNIFEAGQKSIEVIGPILEQEAKKVHEGFW
jgi:tRNA(Arg) A34 adenosine deaminase TadA